MKLFRLVRRSRQYKPKSMGSRRFEWGVLDPADIIAPDLDTDTLSVNLHHAIRFVSSINKLTGY